MANIAELMSASSIMRYTQPGKTHSPTQQGRHHMKYAIALIAGPAAIIGALFFGVPSASAVNPVDCAFNPAVAKAHPVDCKGVTVESVASNGGPPDADGDGNPDYADPTPNG